MWSKRLVLLGGLAWGSLLWTPVPTFAQGIAGVVKDTSGAVLPGVTVEASSPALIEKVRTVVSDSQGQYSIVELTPGTYTVTFVLPGFSTVRREGIVLTTGFTANVNGDLAVGALAETVVVTSAAPIVDTRTITQTSILTDEAIQAIPTGRTTTGFAQLIPGISIAEGGQKFQDVGGLAGEGNSFVIHGSRDNEGMWFVNGMPHSNGSRANASIIRLDVGQVEEFTLETSSISAEYREGGVALNLVGKEGANRFFGTMFVGYANGAMQSDNADDELRARGVGEVNKLDKSYDYNPSVGGPIIRDKLWLLRDLPLLGHRQQARRHLLGQGHHRFPLYTRLEPAACLGRAHQEFRRAPDVAGHGEEQAPGVLPATAACRVRERGTQPDARGPEPARQPRQRQHLLAGAV